MFFLKFFLMIWLPFAGMAVMVVASMWFNFPDWAWYVVAAYLYIESCTYLILYKMMIDVTDTYPMNTELYFTPMISALYCFLLLVSGMVFRYMGALAILYGIYGVVITLFLLWIWTEVKLSEMKKRDALTG